MSKRLNDYRLKLDNIGDAGFINMINTLTEYLTDLEQACKGASVDLSHAGGKISMARSNIEGVTTSLKNGIDLAKNELYFICKADNTLSEQMSQAAQNLGVNAGK